MIRRSGNRFGAEMVLKRTILREIWPGDVQVSPAG
jgi:hypothetical protein